MPTNRETGKDRWKRVPKDYFKKPDRIQRTKFRLWVLALALTLGWCAFGIDWKGREATATSGLSLRANHGTLAQVHAAWDQKCDACHVPFQPIDGRPLLSSRSTAGSRSSDALCTSCHAGPEHHAAAIDAEVRSCAECHRDHRGREASLVRLDDVECTRCHQSLKSVTDPAPSTRARDYADRITRFDRDHPPFLPEGARPGPDKKSLQDKGRLKFNHALHMMPGIVARPGDAPYKVGSIPVASERRRYGQSDAEPVKLDCSSCHVLEASDLKSGPNPGAASAVVPVRGAGKYYQAVNYEAQCRACHVLSFDPKSPDLEAPHGVQPEIVVAFLKRAYAGQMFDQNPRLLETFVPAAPLPGKSPVDASVRKSFEEAVLGAEKVLFQGKSSCLECHYTVKGEGDVVPKAVEATNVPQVWFTHAVFDHTAHQGVSCRECHARSYALEADNKTPVQGASRKGEDVNLPGVENCQQCHAPARGTGGWLSWSSTATTGGVAFDCTECHTYHNGDHSLEGIGARSEHATSQRTIGDFLLGTPPKAVEKARKP